MKVYPVEGRDYLLERPAQDPAVRTPAELAVQDIIDSWPEDDPDRLALEMWAYERLTYAQIAERFGLNAKAAGFYRVKKAQERLQAELEEKGHA